MFEPATVTTDRKRRHTDGGSDSDQKQDSTAKQYTTAKWIDQTFGSAVTSGLLYRTQTGGYCLGGTLRIERTDGAKVATSCVARLLSGYEGRNNTWNSRKKWCTTPNACSAYFARTQLDPHETMPEGITTADLVYTATVQADVESRWTGVEETPVTIKTEGKGKGKGKGKGREASPGRGGRGYQAPGKGKGRGGGKGKGRGTEQGRLTGNF